MAARANPHLTSQRVTIVTAALASANGGGGNPPGGGGGGGGGAVGAALIFNLASNSMYVGQVV